MGRVAQYAMLTLLLVYALLGFATLAAMLAVIDLAAEPDQGITPECVILVVAIWPVLWLRFAGKIAVAAIDDLRAIVQKWASAFSHKPRSISQRVASARSGKLVTRQSMS